MEGAEKPPGPDHPPNAETMKEETKEKLAVILVVLLVVLVLWGLAELAMYLADQFGFAAGFATFMLPTLAATVYIAILYLRHR